MVGAAASLTHLHVKLVENYPSVCSLWVDTAMRWDNPHRGKHEKQIIERKEDLKKSHIVWLQKSNHLLHLWILFEASTPLQEETLCPKTDK